MIKFVMCLARQPDITRAAFKDYWMNKHGPFFMQNADIMGAKKYVQSHTLDTPLNAGLRDSRGMLPEYDGVAEVWFESVEALMEGMSSPEGQRLGAALLEDEKNFVDHSRSSAFIVEECEF
ncbi:MAG: EthD domain-containing protein [Candidatus Thiodiazotropha sp.]